MVIPTDRIREFRALCGIVMAAAIVDIPMNLWVNPTDTLGGLGEILGFGAGLIVLLLLSQHRYEALLALIGTAATFEIYLWLQYNLDGIWGFSGITVLSIVLIELLPRLSTILKRLFSASSPKTNQ